MLTFVVAFLILEIGGEMACCLCVIDVTIPISLHGGLLHTDFSLLPQLPDY